MDSLQILGLFFAAFLGGLCAIFYRYYMPREFTELDYLPPEPVEPPVAPTEPVEAPAATTVPKNPPIAPQATLENFCLALRDFEGKPGDQNYRLNNPGNCRYNPSGYLPKYGKVGKSPNGFAVFKDYATGWLYLQNMVKNMIERHPNRTIEEFMWVYAPPEDNNPTKSYAAFIGKRLGVDSRSFLMKDLT